MIKKSSWSSFWVVTFVNDYGLKFSFIELCLSAADPTLMREGNDQSAVYVVMPMRV